MAVTLARPAQAACKAVGLSMLVQVCPCWFSAGIVLGKHSGRHALASHLHALGYDLSKQEVDDLFKRFKVGTEYLFRTSVIKVPAASCSFSSMHLRVGPTTTL